MNFTQSTPECGVIREITKAYIEITITGIGVPGIFLF
jgi:hypothetical protein